VCTLTLKDRWRFPEDSLVLPVLISWISVISLSPLPAQTGPWPTHAQDSEHTAVSSVAAQSPGSIHWQTPVDLAPPTGEILIHYGSPRVTASNTVIVPVKTGPNHFRVGAHDGAIGTRLWLEDTG
jgi:hypothetical protein